ncbi:CheR family methyltransferase [Aliishimia ponticola]|uniref:CheR family methyltransferase n=1 Tax=Aliishimia ponticola TaxID=2499833 RepID=UPI001FE9DD26|nr:protein-glutamate O-methyltransferase [Aliishimia ponticola]
MTFVEQTPTRGGAEPGFDALSKLAYDEAGLVLSDSKAAMIKSRLRHRLKALSIDNLEAYCNYVKSDAQQVERRHMISALTTNVSGFFREPHHFEQLKSDLVPRMAERIKNGEAVRIWSAGCSNGQEPYSIAMLLASEDPVFRSGDFRILATDIDPQVVAYGATGRYTEAQVAGLDDRQISQFTTQEEDQDGEIIYRVNDDLRRMIAFRELNLIGDWPMRRKFDAIFCRNVVIYFDGLTQERLWPRFGSLLKPDGFVFVGHSERITDPAFKSVGSTAYAFAKPDNNIASTSLRKDN